MNWEAFATPPAQPSEALRRITDQLLHMRDIESHDAVGVWADYLDIKYFLNSGYNPLDRRVPA